MLFALADSEIWPLWFSITFMPFHKQLRLLSRQNSGVKSIKLCVILELVFKFFYPSFEPLKKVIIRKQLHYPQNRVNNSIYLTY